MKKKTLIMALALCVTVLASACGNNAADTVAPTTESIDEDSGSANEASATDQGDGLIISNKLFSITLPKESEGQFIANTEDNRIAIYDKEANEAGFGGFAFDVAAYENPSDYAGGMDNKVGELTTGDGTLYDIVIQYPSDVQFDYEKYTESMPENYERLYKGAEDIVKSLKSADGSGTFVWGAGTKGEDLYNDILDKYVTAVKEGWDANKLEEEGMSSEFFVLAQQADKDPLDAIGYAYYDTNIDGIDELVIGDMSQEEDWKGTVYDIYTMVDRKPAHVISGYARNRFYVLEHGMICNVYSGGAAEYGYRVFDIEPNTTNIMYQVTLKVDEYEDADNPYFISYDDEETWEGYSEEEWNDRLQNFSDYVRFDFTPLSMVAAN